MPWIAKLNPTSAARTSIPKLGTIPRTKLLDVDFGYVFAVAFVLWAFFSCILRPACHHMKHGPYSSPFPRAAYKRLLLSGYCIVRKSLIFSVMFFVVCPASWTTRHDQQLELYSSAAYDFAIFLFLVQHNLYVYLFWRIRLFPPMSGSGFKATSFGIKIF